MSEEVSKEIKEIVFWIPGVPVGKARPRGTVKGGNQHFYTAPNYASYKEYAIAVIKKQMQDLPPAPKPCKVECWHIGFKRNDGDNIEGSIFDALKQANYIQDDNSSNICAGQWQFCNLYKSNKLNKADKIQGILVKIIPSKIEELDLISRYPIIQEIYPQTENYLQSRKIKANLNKIKREGKQRAKEVLAELARRGI